MNIDSLCPWCGQTEEDIDHLFFECELANWGWDAFKSWWHVSFLVTSRAHIWKEIFSRFKVAKFRQAWKMSIAATIWTIWLARNDVVFNNLRISKTEISRVLIYRTFKWALANSWLEGTMERDWCLNP